MIGISTLQFAIRLLLAIAMGAAVGLERQWRQRMAGTRTNALVAAGAAAFVMCGLLLDNDPSARGRIVSYVVSGVGFLGAGVIFKDGASVRGLNTAATIWCSAAIGALSALGSFHLALVLAFAVLFTNMVLRPLAYRLHPVLPEAVPAETLTARSPLPPTSALCCFPPLHRSPSCCIPFMGNRTTQTSKPTSAPR
jgi:putative Mg2+ transporter-C (MgtC) family protein